MQKTGHNFLEKKIVPVELHQISKYVEEKGIKLRISTSEHKNPSLVYVKFKKMLMAMVI